MLQNPAAAISIRTLLIVTIAFNVVAMILTEVQRSALSQATENLIQENEKRRLAWDLAEREHLNELQKDIAGLKSAVQLLQISAEAANAGRLEALIESRLNRGESITLHFDESSLEDRTDDGKIRCWAGARAGYLGVFVASAQYVISYDANTHNWTGTGPSQTRALDPRTAECDAITATYGPKQLGADVLPENGIILWGATFKLNGLDVYQADRKVGRIEWQD